MNRSIFKAYDIRGIYGQDITNEDAYKIGLAIFECLKPKRVAIGRDARLWAPDVQRYVSEALASRGVEVVDLGMVSTDMTIFASGRYDFDLAISVTASHNPREWIGMKFHGRGGVPVGVNGEIATMADIAMAIDEVPELSGKTFETLDLLDEWIDHVLGFVKAEDIGSLKVVVDAGNGVAGPIMSRLAERLPITVVPLFFEPDGNFPNHMPSPIEPENTEALREKVVEVGADLGMAFDGDADRMFFVDEKGTLVTGSETTALVLEALLSHNPKQTVLYNAICGWNVRDVLAKFPEATSARTKVGHAFIKNDMRRLEAKFAGEHSGHYYYQDNFYGDSALITAVFALELISKKGEKFSAILEDYRKYVQIPETNFRVTNTKLVMEEIAKLHSDAEVNWLDGITVTYADWWFNVRASMTEPLLRLNVEAKSADLLAAKVSELSSQITTLAPYETLPA